MIVQSDDVQLIKLINGFGYASASQIATALTCKPDAIQKKLRKLLLNKYVSRQKILHGKPYIYLPTQVGVKYAGDYLKPLTKISLGNYRHNSLLMDLACFLEKKTKGVFIPERRLRHEQDVKEDGLNKRRFGRVSDGHIYIPDIKRPVAIECELSLKSPFRMKEIIESYAADLSLEEIWYFTDDISIARAVLKASTGYSFFKINPYDFSSSMPGFFQDKTHEQSLFKQVGAT